MNNIVHIGILGAMPEEVFSFKKNINFLEERKFGDISIFSGQWIGSIHKKKKIFLSVAWSGWGKVSAARAATRLLSLKLKDIPDVKFLIFSGVAGAASEDLNQWDVVLPSELVQHDMDASPLFQKYVIPALEKSYLQTDKLILDWATSIIKNRLQEDKSPKFGNVFNGLVATGDKFISSESFLNNLKETLPELKAVEMEGASVAQVSMQEEIPFLIIRVISDNAKETAALNFEDFVNLYKHYSWRLLNFVLEDWDNCPLQ